MDELFSENWKVFPAMFLGAFVLGLLTVLYMRDALKKWIFNGHSGSPLTREEHSVLCGQKWEEHIRLTSERWSHNQEILIKNREFLLSEINHLKVGQDKMGVTLDKIFDQLDKMRSQP